MAVTFWDNYTTGLAVAESNTDIPSTTPSLCARSSRGKRQNTWTVAHSVGGGTSLWVKSWPRKGRSHNALSGKDIAGKGQRHVLGCLHSCRSSRKASRQVQRSKDWVRGICTSWPQQLYVTVFYRGYFDTLKKGTVILLKRQTFHHLVLRCIQGWSSCLKHTS